MANALAVSTESTANMLSKINGRVASELRINGYRPVTLWLPDATAPGFAEECRRQSELLKASDSEEKYLNELDLPEVEGWR